MGSAIFVQESVSQNFQKYQSSLLHFHGLASQQHTRYYVRSKISHSKQGLTLQAFSCGHGENYCYSHACLALTPPSRNSKVAWESEIPLCFFLHQHTGNSFQGTHFLFLRYFTGHKRPKQNPLLLANIWNQAVSICLPYHNLLTRKIWLPVSSVINRSF